MFQQGQQQLAADFDGLDAAAPGRGGLRAGAWRLPEEVWATILLCRTQLSMLVVSLIANSIDIIEPSVYSRSHNKARPFRADAGQPAGDKWVWRQRGRYSAIRLRRAGRGIGRVRNGRGHHRGQRRMKVLIIERSRALAAPRPAPAAGSGYPAPRWRACRASMKRPTRPAPTCATRPATATTASASTPSWRTARKRWTSSPPIPKCSSTCRWCSPTITRKPPAESRADARWWRAPTTAASWARTSRTWRPRCPS